MMAVAVAVTARAVAVTARAVAGDGQGGGGDGENGHFHFQIFTMGTEVTTDREGHGLSCIPYGMDRAGCGGLISRSEAPIMRRNSEELNVVTPPHISVSKGGTSEDSTPLHPYTPLHLYASTRCGGVEERMGMCMHACA